MTDEDLKNGPVEGSEPGPDGGLDYADEENILQREIISRRHNDITQISEFMDYVSFNRVINKITDYAEIMTEGRVAGFINFDYRLSSNQTNKVIELLMNIQALSRIYTMAMKGSRDLEVEYISNIYSNPSEPDLITAYLNLKNILENRLTHQVQQYNINMGKNNTTMSMPLHELRGHVKTYRDLGEHKMIMSSKVQHGVIAASLHDAYSILMNKFNFYNEKTYIKYFFNEDDYRNRNNLILSGEARMSLQSINKSVSEVMDELVQINTNRLPQRQQKSPEQRLKKLPEMPSNVRQFNDRMLMTPFGRQYGGKIDGIISSIFSPVRRTKYAAFTEPQMKDLIARLFDYNEKSHKISDYQKEISEIAEYLLQQDYGVKSFTEKFIYTKKEAFNKFYTGEMKEKVENFLYTVFSVYYEEEFSPVFRIIKSLDLKKFACAFIIKRLYLLIGENLTTFGFFFIKTIARIGGIKAE